MEVTYLKDNMWHSHKGADDTTVTYIDLEPKIEERSPDCEEGKISTEMWPSTG
jgi:hypothetical protein